VAVCLTAVFVFSPISSGSAASAGQKASASYRSGSPAAVSRAESVPSNCVRESCGRLWCWKMNGQAGKQ
jgi:hypothetical protein